MDIRYEFRADLILNLQQPNIQSFLGDNATLVVEITSRFAKLDIGNSNASFKLVKPSYEEIISIPSIVDNMLIVELEKICDEVGTYKIYFQIRNDDGQLTTQAINFEIKVNPFKPNSFVLLDKEGYFLKDVQGNQLKVRR